MPRPRRLAWWIAAAIVAANAVLAAVIALSGDPGSDPDGDRRSDRPPDRRTAGRPDAPGGSSDAVSGGPDDAARLVASARAEIAEGHLTQARAQLARAAALPAAPATLLELAAIELQAGRCREARRAVQRVIAEAPGGPAADQAQQLLARIGRCD